MSFLISIFPVVFACLRFGPCCSLYGVQRCAHLSDLLYDGLSLDPLCHDINGICIHTTAFISLDTYTAPLLCMEFLKHCTKGGFFWILESPYNKNNEDIQVYCACRMNAPLPANTATIATSPSSLLIFILCVWQADALSMYIKEEVVRQFQRQKK